MKIHRVIPEEPYLLSSTALTGAAMGLRRPAYQWLFNGTTLTNATNAILVLNSLSTNQAGDYSLVANNVSGSTTSIVAHVFVEPYVLFAEATIISANNTNYDGQDIVISGTTVAMNGMHNFNSIQITNGGILTYSIGTNLNLTISASFSVSSNSVITATGLGYQGTSGTGNGPGGGSGTTASWNCGGGGGYGGQGGTASWGGYSGGGCYGSLTTPTDWGSAGGAGPSGVGGTGGGALRLVVGGLLRVDGALTANGNAGSGGNDYGCGGGDAGGSIWVTAGSLAGSGRIVADGGAGGRNPYWSDGNGGGGGGERIAFYYTSYYFTGDISVNGGLGNAYGKSGGVYTTPHDHTLALNKQVVEFLQTPFSVDQWTFSAVAGQQVRLDGVNQSAPNIAFDLLGTSGWIGFSNVTSQSALVTLPSSGSYTLVARSTGIPGGKTYTYRLQETALTNVVIGTPFTGTFIGSAQAQLFIITNSANMPMQITLINSGAGNRNELYASFGVPPTRGTFDYLAWTPAGASQQLLIPGAYAGDWYVLVYGDTIATPGDYTIQADTAPLFLQSLTPTHSGNSGAAYIDVLGAGFDSSAQVSLVGGTSRAATNVTLVSASHLIADIDLTGLPAGAYQLTVSQGTNAAALPFQVTQAIGPKLVTHLTVPGQLGRHAPATIYIEYANVGDTAMAAPLLVLTASQPAIMCGMAAGAGAEMMNRGFWTSAQPTGWSATIQVLAYGQTPGLLQPGETNTIAIAYAGLLQPWDFWQTRIVFRLGVMTVDNTTLVDWNSWKTNMQPSSIPNDAWDALWSNFLTEAGTTWGDYLRMLNRNATYLRGLGLDVKDLNGLLGFAFAQADSLNALRTLASSTDASVPAPGLSLSFSRFFPQSIYGRYRLGALGRGWTHNWEISLAEASDGTVTVTGPGGSQRVFQPDSRTTGAYFSQAGDHGVFTKSGATFTLTEPRGLMRVFSSDGKLAYTQDPNGNRITAGYSGSLLSTLTHSSGQTLTLAYSGNLLHSITDSLNRTTSFSYDAGQHLQTAAYYDGSQVVYSYVSGQGAGSEHALAQIAYPDGTHQYFTYDSHGRPASMSRDGGAEMLTLGYEGGGNVDVTDAYANTTRFYLDHRDLLAKALNPLTNAVRLVYDADFNLTSITDPANRSYAYAYDYNGNLSQATDPLGGNTRFLYGTLNRLAALTDAKGNVTRYAGDARGNLTAITYADNSAERWGYDGSGNPTTWTNRRANGITCQVNAAGQLTAKLYPDGRTINYRYNTRALLTNITDSVQGITRVAYDAREFVTNITYPDGRGFNFTYDPAGRRTSGVGFDGYALNYSYDAAGRLATLTDGSSNQLVQYTYDADGRLSRETKGNGTATTYAYNNAGQLVALTNSAPDSSVQSFFNYGYDSKGNRLSMTNAAGVTAFAYDDLNQLTGVAYPNGRHIAYTYDGAGNRTAVNDTGTNTVYTPNSLNEYTQVGTAAYGYDSDGNMTNRTDASGTTTYQFDSENRLIGVTTPANGTWQCIYDSLGNRSAVVHNGLTNRYLLDPFGLVDVAAEYDSGGNLIARYAHALGLVARSDTSEAAAYYSFDALGNTRQLTGIGGGVLNSYDYDVFGVATFAGETVSNCFRFVGRFGVAEEPTGAHFMRARFYLSDSGHFISDDPIGLQGGDINCYRYAQGNPMSWVDPSGLGYFEKGPLIIGNIKFPVRGPFYHEQYFRDDGSNFGFGPSGNPMWSSGRWFSLSPNEAKLYTRVDQHYYDDNAIDQIKNDYGRSPGTYSLPIRNCQTVARELQTIYSLTRSPIPPTTNSESDDSSISTLGDPNQLTGPAGYGPRNYVQGGSLFSYRIDFEITNALAVPNFGPAQVVLVSDPLTNTLDWTTLQLTEVGFGSQFFAITPGTQHYEQTAHVNYNSVSFDVHVEAALNPVTGVLTVSYQSLDPKTGLPPQGTNGLVGFLQPEDGTGRGMGHVSFLVRPKPGLPTGTAIRNIATISYDPSSGGPSYRTDLSVATDPNSVSDSSKQALVTIDVDLPTSTATSLPATATNATFTVAWTGTDIGAGVAGYDVYVQTNYGPWNLWLANTPLTSALFQGQNGRAYCFYSLARDGVGLVQTNYTIACTQTMTNYPPVIDPVTNQFAIVGGQLVITNQAHDPDGVTFSLDPSAPAGATITTNGIFKWTPACAQGSSTNFIIVWATDGGTPPMSSSNSFTITVPECIEASVGDTMMLIGQTSSVPVRLLSTTALTNMAFTLVYPSDRFTNFALTVNSPQVLTQQLRSLDAGSMQVSFTLPASSILHGPTNIGLLSFAALSNQSSAFVPLVITNVTSLKAEGGLAAKAFGQSGRVVVVGPEPLLEAGWAVNKQPLLTLYGKPGSSYAMEWRTNLMAGAWQYGWRAPMTNLVQDFGIGVTKPGQFYRAYEFFADPPILEIPGAPAGSLPLLFYGRRGTNYVLESSPVLGSQAHWLPQLSLTLSNSFDFLPPLPMTNRSLFLRIRE